MVSIEARRYLGADQKEEAPSAMPLLSFSVLAADTLLVDHMLESGLLLVARSAIINSITSGVVASI